MPQSKQEGKSSLLPVAAPNVIQPYRSMAFFSLLSSPVSWNAARSRRVNSIVGRIYVESEGKNKWPF